VLDLRRAPLPELDGRGATQDRDLCDAVLADKEVDPPILERIEH
jgi:hypothetical protein